MIVFRFCSLLDDEIVNFFTKVRKFISFFPQRGENVYDYVFFYSLVEYIEKKKRALSVLSMGKKIPTNLSNRSGFYLSQKRQETIVSSCYEKWEKSLCVFFPPPNSPGRLSYFQRVTTFFFSLRRLREATVFSLRKIMSDLLFSPFTS